jgi:hypothetical protein
VWLAGVTRDAIGRFSRPDEGPSSDVWEAEPWLPSHAVDEFTLEEPAFLRESRGELIAPAPGVEFKTVKEFCDAYTPLSYTVEPFIRSSSLYTLTAKTGSGKTALLIIKALAVASGRADILGREVTQGRVAYIAAENPDDLRMRIRVAAFQLTVDLAAIGENLVILDRRVKPEDLVSELQTLAKVQPFALIMIDTLAAFFDGKDMNDNVQGGDFMRRLRPLTRIAGLPSVIVASHPVKTASDEQLVPYGGGAILNEVDGNLTVSKSNGLVRLHWQGKLRGLEFPPALFRIENASSPDVVDTKGRQVELPVMRPMTENEAERREAATVNDNIALLRAMIAEPSGSIRTWAASCGFGSKSRVEKALPSLASDKLIKKAAGKWMLTRSGEKAARKLE